jgi:phenol 2-monooxygenase (NADPH)
MPELFRSHWSKLVLIFSVQKNSFILCRVFVDQKEVRGNRGGIAYASFGIDPAGVVVIVRPDGYVGMIAPLDQVRSVNHYFATFSKDV